MGTVDPHSPTVSPSSEGAALQQEAYILFYQRRLGSSSSAVSSQSSNSTNSFWAHTADAAHVTRPIGPELPPPQSDRMIGPEPPPRPSAKPDRIIGPEPPPRLPPKQNGTWSEVRHSM